MKKLNFHSNFLYLRPASFHTLFYTEKFPQLRSLFDDALTERVVTFHKRKKAADNSQVRYFHEFFLKEKSKTSFSLAAATTTTNTRIT